MKKSRRKILLRAGKLKGLSLHDSVLASSRPSHKLIRTPGFGIVVIFSEICPVRIRFMHQFAQLNKNGTFQYCGKAVSRTYPPQFHFYLHFQGQTSRPADDARRQSKARRSLSTPTHCSRQMLCCPLMGCSVFSATCAHGVY